MSRDWVIDKMTIGVTYDSDVDKAKKLIKDIGKQLAADPEFERKLFMLRNLWETHRTFAVNHRRPAPDADDAG